MICNSVACLFPVHCNLSKSKSHQGASARLSVDGFQETVRAFVLHWCKRGKPCSLCPVVWHGVWDFFTGWLGNKGSFKKNHISCTVDALLLKYFLCFFNTHYDLFRLELKFAVWNCCEIACTWCLFLLGLHLLLLWILHCFRCIKKRCTRLVSALKLTGQRGCLSQYFCIAGSVCKKTWVCPISHPLGITTALCLDKLAKLDLDD